MAKCILLESFRLSVRAVVKRGLLICFSGFWPCNEKPYGLIVFSVLGIEWYSRVGTFIRKIFRSLLMYSKKVWNFRAGCTLPFSVHRVSLDIMLMKVSVTRFGRWFENFDHDFGDKSKRKRPFSYTVHGVWLALEKSTAQPRSNLGR